MIDVEAAVGDAEFISTYASTLDTNLISLVCDPIALPVAAEESATATVCVVPILNVVGDFFIIFPYVKEGAEAPPN